MQDIRKPYTRSRSNNDLQSRVEQFETASYRRDDDYYDDEPVRIPTGKTRRDVRDMDMYPRKRRNRDEEEFYDEEDDHQDTRGRRASPRKKITGGTAIFIALTLLVIVGAALYTYVFDSATITFVPKYKEINEISKVIPFSKDGADSSAVPFIVEQASLSRSKTLTLSESRKVEAKATGKITIYNNYDNNTQKLIKNTRFESTQGKIYRIAQSVEVPGKKGDIPGSVDVTVYADATGATYNVTNTDFTIPGFKGTPRANAFYAKTKTALTGGSSGTMSLVALSDLNAAKDALAVELNKDIQTEILKIKKDGYIPLYSAVEVVYDDNENELLTGATGVYKVTATGYVILADAPKFAQMLAKNFADYANDPVRVGLPDMLKYTRKQAEHVNSTTTLSILVEGTTRIIWDTNLDTLKTMVLGKSRDEFKPVMKTLNSVESAEISFSPLWLSHFPEETSKIKVIESLPATKNETKR